MSQRTILALLATTALLGCRVSPAAVSPSPAAGWTGPTGTVALSVSIAGTRRVQWVESYRATAFTAEVTGAGISGWVPLTPVDNTTGTFGQMGTDGFRVASLAAKVPAGDRRVFRVKVYDTTPEPDELLETLWGVGDVPANTGLQNTYPVTVKPMTTPTGQIFYRLLQLDEPKALTLPIDNVQHFVEELLNTNSVNNDALRVGVPQVNPAVLDVDKATVAIVRGNSGVPFQIPAPIPDALLQRDATDPLKRSLPDAMRQRGQVHARVVDVFGRTVSRAFGFYLTDTATTVRQADATHAADVTWDEVAPGDWALVANDLERGTTQRKSLSVPVGGLTEAFVVTPPSFEPVAGSYNAEADAADSFNGENVPASLAYLSDPGGFTVNGGVVTYVDAGNQRLRRFAADVPPAIIHTIAGNGLNAHTGDGGAAADAWMTLNNGCDVVVDTHGVTYVSQADGTVRAIGTDGVIRLFWAPTPWYSYDKLAKMAYDPTRHALLVACPGSSAIYRLNLNVYTGANPAQGYDSTKIATTGIDKLPLGVGGAYVRVEMDVSGDYAFVVSYDSLNGKPVMHRVNLATNQVDQLIGTSPTAAAGDDTPAAQMTDSSPHGVSVDDQGNVFFVASGGLYRVTNAAGTLGSATVKLVTADPNIAATTFDRAQGQLYVLRRKAFLNAAGTPRMVPVIERLVP